MEQIEFTQKSEPVDEQKIKAIQLNMENIKRMADNSSKCKNFCITLCGILIAYMSRIESITWNQYIVLLFPILLILTFWILDAKYLQLERAFVKKSHDILYYIEVPTGFFNFNPRLYIDNYTDKVPNLLKTMFSWSCVWIYISLIVIYILSSLLIKLA